MSSIVLRHYQQKLKDGIYAEWRDGHRNVLAVAPTGAGKTVLFSSIFQDFGQNPSIAIAHRQELVSQISCALASIGIVHRIVAATPVVKFCIQQHHERFGRNFHHANSPVAVAGVKTILKRARELEQWCRQVRLWVQDEAHHVLPENSWGKAAALFPSALGLGVTASPIRCDRRPLGRSIGGMFDRMVIGPTMRQLIREGFLADYRIFAPPESINLANVRISEATGDFNQHSLREEAHKSTITGDIVDHYMRLAPGKRGITFAVDVEQATEIAARFNAAGVAAEAVSGETPDHIRQHAINRFRSGHLVQLVNVDLFGEGFDVPAVEVVSMGRPTESFGLYIQQFGRALRPLEGKTHGILLDHVGNVKRHGLPDAVRNWNIDIDERGARKARARDDVIPVTTCVSCYGAFEAVTKTCPHCGFVQVPMARNEPRFVDGDLMEFSPELLARLRGEIERVEEGGPAIPYDATEPIRKRLTALWRDRQETLQQLRASIDAWGGVQVHGLGREISEAYRVFFHTFGVDVMTAQTLTTAEMRALDARIQEHLA